MRRSITTPRAGVLITLLAVFGATAASAQDIKPVQAQTVEPYKGRQLDSPQAAQGSIDGIYRLTILGNSAPPVRTPSEYGTVQGGALAIKGNKYAIQYVYGQGQKLDIEGTLAVTATTVTFRPTTPGISGSTAVRRGGDIVSTIDGAFGLRNASIVFSFDKPLPGADEPSPPTPRNDPPQPQPQPRDEPKPQPQPKPMDECPVVGGSNLVEPLSNGLQLSWSLDDIMEKFGEGESSWDSRSRSYPNFKVQVGGADVKIWHLHLTSGGACLSSGIHVGSSKSDVQRVFGRAYSATHGQYKLTFQYDGDRLVDIGIDPANGEFTPVKRGAPSPTPSKPTPSNPTPSNPTPSKPTPSKPSTGNASSILGTWWGVQSMTQIDVKADGTYSSPNGGKGTWRMSGEDIYFTGALSGWNGGHGKLTKGGWIEFLWKDASGYAYLFQLIRR